MDEPRGRLVVSIILKTRVVYELANLQIYLLVSKIFYKVTYIYIVANSYLEKDYKEILETYEKNCLERCRATVEQPRRYLVSLTHNRRIKKCETHFIVRLIPCLNLVYAIGKFSIKIR